MRCKDGRVIAIISCISVINSVKDNVCGTEAVDGRVIGFIWRNNISAIQGYRGPIGDGDVTIIQTPILQEFPRNDIPVLGCDILMAHSVSFCYAVEDNSPLYLDTFG